LEFLGVEWPAGLLVPFGWRKDARLLKLVEPG
jgi:hypothetical protein